MHGLACRHLKNFLISFALAWIQQQKKITLDAKYKLPKMHYKGERISSQIMRMDKQLVKDMGDVVDPEFPLMTKRRPITVPRAPTGSFKTRDGTAQAAISSSAASSQQAGVDMSAQSTSSTPGTDSTQSAQPPSSQGVQCKISDLHRPMHDLLTQGSLDFSLKILQSIQGHLLLECMITFADFAPCAAPKFAVGVP